MTTSGDLTNSGAITLDRRGLLRQRRRQRGIRATGGGSFLKINGTLTNSGTIGSATPRCRRQARSRPQSVVNDGTINALRRPTSAQVHATLHSSGTFTNDGSVNFSDDNDKIAGAISGTGNFSLSNGSTLEFGAGVSSGETVTFASGVDQLILDQPSSFNGTIDDFFTAGDAVIAKAFAEAATLLTYTQTGADSCSWTLTDGANTAVLNFAGEPYAKSDFSIVRRTAARAWRSSSSDVLGEARQPRRKAWSLAG